ncbi:MAG TPA: type II and III secretion system protein family protein [Stellaceae bacterium]|nr:type II and III secretion system protein family protein [Stellaceae bacterium]
MMPAPARVFAPALAAALVAALPVLAQGPRGPALVAPAVAPPATGAPAGRLFAVGIGKSQLIHLARPARDVMVASPGVADVVLQTPDTAFLIGRIAGETTVYFFDTQGRQIDALDVTVVFDTSALVDALKRALPYEAIDVATVNTSIVLSGTVSSQHALDDAVAIASQFVGGTGASAPAAPAPAAGTTPAGTATATAAPAAAAGSNGAAPSAPSGLPARIVNLLRVRNENQVLLRVRVSEMSRTVIKELGVSPGAVFNLGRGSGAFSTTTLTSPTIPATRGGGSVGGVPAPGIAFSTSGVSASATFPASPFGGAALAIPFTAATGLTALIEALDENGLAKTLAEPNLTAVSGETASFLVGGSVPICQTTFTNSGQTVVPTQNFIYKPFGIQLTFTPVVLSDGLVNIRITAEISTLETTVAAGAIAPTVNTCGAPAFTSENVTTTVELPSGGSIALAGLLKNDESNSLQGIPGIMNVPVLGALFSSKAYQQNLDDLVVSVTAVLVKPTAPGEIAYPTDGFGPSSDFNFYFMNRLQSTYAPGATTTLPAAAKSVMGLILE